MKILFIPLFKLIYTVFMSLIELLTMIIVCICQSIWYFKIKPEVFEYTHNYPVYIGDDVDLFTSYFEIRNNYYSAYFKHNSYKSTCSQITFKTGFHYLWGCKPYKYERINS